MPIEFLTSVVGVTKSMDKFDIEEIHKEMLTLPIFEKQLCLQGVEGVDDIFLGSTPITPESKYRAGDFTTKIFDLPILNKIIEKYGLVRTRIIKIAPQWCYKIHTDIGYRFHLPIVTNENCFFIINKNFYHMAADGHYYIMNAYKPHTAVNASGEERIHLIANVKRK